MLIRRRCDAEVQIILITDEPAEARRLARAIEAMRYRIYFRSFASTPLLTIPICLLVSCIRPSLPTAIVVDYFCHVRRCPDVLGDLFRSYGSEHVELIVANAPDGADTRAQLMALGARTVVSEPLQDCSAIIH
jgi:hypothetical protein